MTGILDIASVREEICLHGRSLFDRGYASGSSGNLSVRLADGSMLVTPTNASLGRLDPETIAHLDTEGRLLDGAEPSKEALLHRAVYDARTQARGIVHLHATHSAAVSCMAGLDSSSCLPPLTAYFVMKIGHLPLIEYHRPGDPDLPRRIATVAREHPAFLLANHGPIVAGRSLAQAVNAAEELEETARLFLLLRGSATRLLDCEQIEILERVFGRATDA